MASAKEIRNQIKSIKNTQKITKAMEMVAASKMRKAQDQMIAARPYADKIKNVVGHLALAHPEYKHSFLVEREDVKTVGYIFVSSDRGLCGGLNTNVFKKGLKHMEQWNTDEVAFDLCTIGKKAAVFFKRFNGNLVSSVQDIGDNPNVNELIGSIKVMIDAYREGEIDRLYLVANEFVNTIIQDPTVTTLLPLPESTDEELAGKKYWDYIYEPEAKEVMDEILIRYIESLVFKAVVENIASEMASRMVAMKSATDNAGDLISDLQRVYNKARQAAITQEISEIVSGASAV
jgi:F-type H+-transporting ATPase subunit gamma